jgi:methyl-accepting chemotaxis protein
MGVIFDSFRTRQSNVSCLAATNTDSAELNQNKQKLDGVDKAMARIEFDPTGVILEANENFLQCTGYRESEIVGEHHSMFVDPEEVATPAYRQFWNDLASGKANSSEFCRRAKNGDAIWIQASYIPILDADGHVERVIKFASDITEKKNLELFQKMQLDAVHRSTAVIEFKPDGTIVDANANFLNAVGYRLDEIRGQHHRIFVSREEQHSAEYQGFWESLAAGTFYADRFRRFNKEGREIWIQASYNPISNAKGEVIGVVKFATDITAQVESEQRILEVGGAVASSTTEMTSTINEISQSVSRTAMLASNTEELTTETTVSVSELAENSRVIEKVVEVIQELADQTNLLALNAQIESARAGEAGRGFAVVANEVKTLANATADATKNIEKSIREIQSGIETVVGSTGKITKRVSEVNANMATIAAAVEEQSATMQSLSHTANELQDCSY